jgi:hypothetical protein
MSGKREMEEILNQEAEKPAKRRVNAAAQRTKRKAAAKVKEATALLCA